MIQGGRKENPEPDNLVSSEEQKTQIFAFFVFRYLHTILYFENESECPFAGKNPKISGFLSGKTVCFFPTTLCMVEKYKIGFKNKTFFLFSTHQRPFFCS